MSTSIDKLIKLADLFDVSVSAIAEERRKAFKTKEAIYNWEHMKSEGNVPVSSFVIFLLQEKYNIKFPEVLKKFYYKHNGEKSYLCIFGTDRQYEISKFLPLTGICDSFEELCDILNRSEIRK